MARTWRFLPYDSGLVRSLTGALQISPVLAQILSARGMTNPDAAAAFLNSKLSELHDPELLPGVCDAADRVVAALRSGRKITIYGDYDVDGVTATSLLWHCLRLAGGNVEYYVPHRLEEGYGLNCDALRKLHKEDPQQLVITVDCGIASVTEAELAQELGLELIITDHHHIGTDLPPAACLVHPRLPGTSYPFGELCGVGVAFKLAWGICQRLGDGKRASPHMRQFLISAVGLAAIGTVADVVPLLDENRVIVRFGLTALRDHLGVGMQALLKVAKLSETPVLQAEDIAFGLAPRINAVGRLGQARLAVELLTTDNAERATALAEYIDQQNKVRQTVERKIFKQAKELVEEHPEWESSPALVLAHPEWHPGVIGIVASRVVEHFQKPTLMISTGRDDGIAQASGRSFAGFDLYAGLAACESHLVGFGGHQAAAGMRIAVENVDAFRDSFCEYVGEFHRVEDHHRELRIDAEVRFSDLTPRAVKELDRLGPFGAGNPRPVLSSSKVELAEPPRKMGGGEQHLAVSLRQQGRRIRGISFGHADWADEMAAVQTTLSVSYAPIINHFGGRESVEIHLLDWKSDDETNPVEPVAQVRGSA